MTDAPDSSPGAPAPAPETILLVEDEEAVRTLIRKILHRSGYAVLEARNGGEALQLADQHAGMIDLLLTDVVMPSMNGPQLVQRLGALRPQMKVVYMSGYLDSALASHANVRRATYLAKPFTPDELARAVRAALDAD